MRITKYGTFDQATNEQIELITKSKAFEGENIAIMPDAHKGAGGPVGFTSTFTDKIIPNLVGVDVGCGMTLVKLPSPFTKDRFKELYEVIKKNIPYGSNRHSNTIMRSKAISLLPDLDNLSFNISPNDKIKVLDSLGSLGGGNHFIEVNENASKELFLVIHSGSRSLGQMVARTHQNIAKSNFINSKPSKEQILKIEPSKRTEFIKNYKGKKIDDTPSPGLEYLVNSQTDKYLNDMSIAQEYARLNRERMIRIIFTKLNLPSKNIEFHHTIHNWIDVTARIIRKGSVYADPNNDIIIPLNMRDGSIIARGKKNKIANFSAPHGAGRVMSRTQAFKEISFESFEDSMKDVTSWTVSKSTIDEAPFAYKSKEFIVENLKNLVIIKEIIKPVFNFKDDTPSKKY